MKRTLKIISFYLINLILFAALALALFIYISFYEKFFSDVHLALILRENRYLWFGLLFCSQLFIILGMSLLRFRHSFPVSTINNLIPFISFAEFLLMFFIIKAKGIYVLYSGISTNAILIVLLIFTVSKTMILIKKGIIEID